MKPKEFKTLRKSCFKTAKSAAEYFGTPYETWRSWENGARPLRSMAVKAMELYLCNQKLRDGIKAMRDSVLISKLIS